VSDNPNGRPKGSRNKASQEIAQLARRLLSDRPYRRHLKARLRDGTAPHIEALLYYYAYGKPVERHELTGTDGAPLPPALVIYLPAKDAAPWPALEYGHGPADDAGPAESRPLGTPPPPPAPAPALGPQTERRQWTPL
jgi:hypothetical protein